MNRGHDFTYLSLPDRVFLMREKQLSPVMKHISRKVMRTWPVGVARDYEFGPQF